MDHLFQTKPTVSTKQKIFETAVDLFSMSGFAAVSVREITKHVGIKESALYNHFKTKDDILEAIYTAFRSERSRALPSIDDLDAMLERVPLDAFLKQGFRTFVDTVENPLYVKMWRILNMEQYRDARARAIVLDDLYGGTIAFLEAVFAWYIERGALRAQDPKMLAFEYQYPMFAVMTEYLLLRLEERETAELERRVERHIQSFIERLAPK
ncbi:TetR/AcrR family transcriptional regulator [Paenibacillus sp. TRM 82003]|nr:TetR/AcrR family transcriptional regulator [Paenibacillus sp. TRM 82003]